MFEKSKREFSRVIKDGGKLKVVNPRDLANKYEQKRAAQSELPRAKVTTCLISLFKIFLLFLDKDFYLLG